MVEEKSEASTHGGVAGHLKHYIVRQNTVLLSQIKGMEAHASKDERIELRVSSPDKMIFKRAQKLSGDKSLSSFIVRIVRQQAEEIVAKNDRIIATERDRQVFFDAVFGNNKPDQNLVEAAKRFKAVLSGKIPLSR